MEFIVLACETSLLYKDLEKSANKWVCIFAKETMVMKNGVA